MTVLRFILTLFAVNAMTLPAFAASAIELNGTRYELAFVNELPTRSLNEYIPPGETLDKWTKMLALHIYHNQQISPEQFALELMKLVVKLNPDAPKPAIAGKSSQGDIVIDFVTWPQDKAYIEYNVFKFKKGNQPGDIIGYQYAMRSYGHPPSDNFMAAIKNTLPFRKELGEAPFPQFISKNMQ